MLSTDVGAASAASTRLQESPASVGGRRDTRPSSDDEFGAMFDRCADAKTADDGRNRGGVRKAAPQARQTQTAGPSAESTSTGAAPVRTRATSAKADDGSARPVKDDGDREDADVVAAIDPLLIAPLPPSMARQPECGGTAQGRSLADLGVPLPQPLGPRTLAVTVPEPATDGPALPDAALLTAADAEPVANAESTPFDEQVASPAGAASRNTDGTVVIDAVNETSTTGSTGATSTAPTADARPTRDPHAAARQIALAALQSALGPESTATEHASQASAVAAAQPVASEGDPAVESAAVVASATVTPEGLQRAVASAAPRAAEGLARAVAHASKTVTAEKSAHPEQKADTPDSTTAAELTEVTVDPTPAAQKEPAQASASHSARPQQVMNAPVAQPQEASTAATLLAQARKGDRQEVPTAQPARTPARVAQAIAAFQAAATVVGTGTVAAMHSQVAAAASTARALLDRELPTQIVQAVRVQFDNGSGEARVRLNPGFLGGLTVGVQVDGTSVVASLQASNTEVREWMQRNEQALRQSLADQGLHLERLVIVDEESRPSSDDERGGGRREPQDQQAPRRPRRPADQGTFELVL